MNTHKPSQLQTRTRYRDLGGAIIAAALVGCSPSRSGTETLASVADTGVFPLNAIVTSQVRSRGHAALAGEVAFVSRFRRFWRSVSGTPGRQLRVARRTPAT